MYQAVFTSSLYNQNFCKGSRKPRNDASDRAACILDSLIHRNGYGRAGGGGPQVSKHTTSRCAIVLQDPFAAETLMQVDVSRIANTRVSVHAHYRGRRLSWVG